MKTPAAFPSSGKPRFPWVVPVSFVVVVACVGLLVSFASQRSLQAAGTGGYSAATLFNQANADARGGRTAQAIVGYERARFLAPADESVRANLGWARTRAGLPAPGQNWFERAVSRASPNTMAWLGSLGLILAGAGWVFARPQVGARAFFLAAGFCGWSLVAVSIAGAVFAWQTSREAVVVAADAPARIAPTTVSEVSFQVPAGEITTMRGHYGDFVLVGDASGRTGWVSRRDLQPVLPAAPAGSL